MRWFNSSRFCLEKEITDAASSIPRDALVLDAGCGDAQYRHLFSHTRYETADFKQVDKAYADEITYVCDLTAIPVPDNIYDYVLCSQVAEHLPEPTLVFKEIFRVLKPGGRVMCTAPLFYEEHEQPYDFFRYTQFGFKHILSSAGFDIIRVDRLEGYFGTAAYFFDLIARTSPMRPGKKEHPVLCLLLIPLMLFVKALTICFSILFHQMEKHMKIADRIGKNYVIMAVKPIENNK